MGFHFFPALWLGAQAPEAQRRPLLGEVGAISQLANELQKGGMAAGFFSNLSFGGDLAAVLCPLLNTSCLPGPWAGSAGRARLTALEGPSALPRLRTGDPTNTVQRASRILWEQKFTE